MDYISEYSDVYCSKEACGKLILPENINWDYTFDYDGNDRVHTYGRYHCSYCNHEESFNTNDPYENDDDDDE
jgi:hypothetical protein